MRQDGALSRLKGVVMAVVIASQGAAVHAQTTPAGDPRVEVSVTDIRAVGLVTTVASLTKQKVVVAPDFEHRRLSFRGTFADGAAALDEIARQLGARVVQVGSIKTLQGRCPSAAEVPLPAAAAPHSVTTSFQGVRVEQFVETLGRHVAGPGKPTKFVSTSSRRFSIHERDTPVHEVFDAMVAAGGLTRVSRNGRHLFVESTASADCADSPPPANARTYAPFRDLTQASCPTSRKGKAFRCEPLEFYALREVSMKGQLRVADRYHALAETQDGHVHAVQRGTYMGKDYGKVLDVSLQGVALREIVVDDDGDGFEQKVWMGYVRESADTTAAKEELDCPVGTEYRRAEDALRGLIVESCRQWNGKPHGPYRQTRLSDGSLSHTSRFVDGRRDGPSDEYDEQGRLTHTVQMAMGVEGEQSMTRAGFEALARDITKGLQEDGRNRMTLRARDDGLVYEHVLRYGRGEISAETVRQLNERMASVACPLVAALPSTAVVELNVFWNDGEPALQDLFTVASCSS